MEFPVYPDGPTVYFLVHGGLIVYIGQTNSMKRTWQGMRHRDKTYDRLFCVEVTAQELSMCEQACIIYFRPKYNVQVSVRNISEKTAAEYVEKKLDGTGLLGFPRNSSKVIGNKKSYVYEYPRPSMTVDVVVFGFHAEDKVDPLKVLLIQRGEEPFKNSWALPGGFVQVSDLGGQGEDLEKAARRELKEETKISVQYLEQLYTYGSPRRDPRGRVISVAYLALVDGSKYFPQGGDDASAAEWVGIKSTKNMKLAFDHAKILRDASNRLKAKIRYTPIGLNLLPESFALSDLRLLYEGILEQRLDPSNFNKRVLETSILTAIPEKVSGGGRPAQLYTFDRERYNDALSYGTFHLDLASYRRPEKRAPDPIEGIGNNSVQE